MITRVASIVGLLLLLLTGCTAEPSPGAVPTSTTPPDRGALAEFDVCTVLTPEQSQELGLFGPGEPYNVYPESGCRFTSERLLLTLGRNIEDEGFGFYLRNSERYAEFELNTVAGRDGAHIVLSHTGNSCNQVVAAGHGHVVVQVMIKIAYEDVLDSCGQAYRIAEMIAPQLPEVGT